MGAAAARRSGAQTRPRQSSVGHAPGGEHAAVPSQGRGRPPIWPRKTAGRRYREPGRAQRWF
eukprot:1862373-Pyramimonas_sp.AAC.1